MLYLLDTNVISELRKRERMNESVKAWSGTLRPNNLFLSVMTIGEIRKAIEEKRNRDSAQAIALEAWMERTIRDFGRHILPVTLPIANRWGTLCITQRLPDANAYLAATALEHDLTLATRNTTDFACSGVKLVNPWSFAG